MQLSKKQYYCQFKNLILSIYANSLPVEVEAPLPIRSACHVPRSKNYVDLLAIIEGDLE